jgi:alanine racemase
LSGHLTIDLGAIVANWRMLAALRPQAQCGAVVKANAYGLGLEPVCEALLKAGCRTFFVATLQEGERLRALSREPVIYVLNGLMSGQTAAMLASRLRPVLGSYEEISEWLASHGEECALHIDTGMNRLGLRPEEALGALAHTGLVPSLILTHLACADQVGHPKTIDQLRRFKDVVALMPDTTISYANSAGCFIPAQRWFDLGADTHQDAALIPAQSAHSKFDETSNAPVSMTSSIPISENANLTTTSTARGPLSPIRGPISPVHGPSSPHPHAGGQKAAPSIPQVIDRKILLRPGIALYGGNPFTSRPNPMQQVLTLEVPILQVRDVFSGESVGYGGLWQAKKASRIAILSAGYADGIHRSLSSATSDTAYHVMVANTPCPIIGRISMDLTAIDITETDAKRGDKAIIIDNNNNELDRIAAAAGTIPYEILTSLSTRYKRTYLGG